jgi:hypothetical protein
MNTITILLFILIIPFVAFFDFVVFNKWAICDKCHYKNTYLWAWILPTFIEVCLFFMGYLLGLKGY